MTPPQKHIARHAPIRDGISPRRTLSEIREGIGSGQLLAWRLFRRDLKTEFVDSYLGYLWNFAAPLVIAGAFLVLRSGGLIDADNLPIPFGAYVMYGVLLLEFFMQTVLRGMTVLRRSGVLVTNAFTVPEALVMADLLRAGFDMCCQSLILLIASIWVGAIDPGGFLLYLLLTPFLALFGYGIGLLLATINVVYRDGELLVQNMMRPLIFICPTFYRPADPESFLYWLDTVNPIAIFMNNLRLLATLGEWHSPLALAVTSSIGLLLLCLGWYMFHVTIRLASERL